MGDRFRLAWADTGYHVAFLDLRRELRPVEEYRNATSEEWAEFDEHHDKFKVELGSCGGP